MNKRLTKEERKKEILNAAKKVFLEKGFSRTTMEAVINNTTLSKGGVYYYYKSTKEMIFDIFMEGNDYRINIINNQIKNENLTNDELKNVNTIANFMTDKVLDDNYLMELYVMFLIELKYDEDLRILFSEIVEGSREKLSGVFFNDEVGNVSNNEEFMFITNIINTFILGTNVLNARENFLKNREVIKEMIKTGIECFKKRSSKG